MTARGVLPGRVRHPGGARHRPRVLVGRTVTPAEARALLPSEVADRLVERAELTDEQIADLARLFRRPVADPA